MQFLMAKAAGGNASSADDSLDLSLAVPWIC